MRVLIAFDKFKGSLSAAEAGETTRSALQKIHPEWEFDLCPLADGGDGLVDILTRASGGTQESVNVTGPRGKPVAAAVGKISSENIPSAARVALGLPSLDENSGRIFVIEMAAASGLALLASDERDPWRASTRGTGELLQHAADSGAAAIVLGLGGSATHDLGLGALSALGTKFFDERGALVDSPVPFTWETLGKIESSPAKNFPSLRLACDVTNPLLGPNGAAATYAPQKGLAANEIARLDQASARMGQLLCAHFGRPWSLAEEPGAGAAGGIAFGLRVGLGAQLVSGFSLVAAWTRLEERLAAADLVITGEGKFDATSGQGKAAGAVAQLTLAAEKPVHVFAGRVDASDHPKNLVTHEISPRDLPIAEAMSRAKQNLARAVATAFPAR